MKQEKKVRKWGDRCTKQEKKVRKWGDEGTKQGGRVQSEKRMARYPPPITLSPDRSTVGQDPGYSPGRIGSALLRDQASVPVNRVIVPGRLHLLP
ncbi:hypothetical protein [Methanoculleus sp.]|uniref:hypothetical protein n=1 Tax=Methanoculleus sp. TaxID=90427 RepID=UPI00272EBF1E|nr:hypothetical protein [Methanoculleus sp.]